MYELLIKFCAWVIASTLVRAFIIKQYFRDKKGDKANRLEDERLNRSLKSLSSQYEDICDPEKSKIEREIEMALGDGKIKTVYDLQTDRYIMRRAINGTPYTVAFDNKEYCEDEELCQQNFIKWTDKAAVIDKRHKKQAELRAMAAQRNALSGMSGMREMSLMSAAQRQACDREYQLMMRQRQAMSQQEIAHGMGSAFAGLFGGSKLF